MKRIRRLAAVGALAGLTAVVGACGDGEETETAAADTAPTPTEPAAPTTSDATAAAGQGVTTIEQIYGPACDQVPTEGEGSAQGMIDDPVGTAASNNPLLTTLSQAVARAELDDTLNNPEASFTVFAPANSAFEQLPPGTLEQLSQQELTSILTYHVVAQRYDAQGLAEAGTVTTVQGDQLTISGQQGSLVIDEQEQASVLCGNIPTANATVFVIDTVLLPEGVPGLPSAPATEGSAPTTG